MLDTLNFGTTFLSKMFHIPSVQDIKTGQERTDAAYYTSNSPLKGMPDYIFLKQSTIQHLLNRTSLNTDRSKIQEQSPIDETKN